MQYDVSSTDEYIAVLENDWRKEKLLQLREIIKQSATHLVEGINYKMLSYADQKGVIFHLNAQMNYVSFYVGDASKVDPSGELLKGIDVGKGCLRFKKSVDPNNTQIDSFIKKAVLLWQNNVDIGC
ncbi:iron chaperone [Roseivirga misakiensis]|uniref:YdhG-like domain-containing protein n=1 Tax=Roseivirga misakiensis TaxID=1563681 RepID=A0A1E5T033_9BACT|nr:DUF1801 domain-containing protein [Roseivirga misakiensis]OEK04719.1 hypothetical protein BFP71_14825 [Roseivirga misakiensis]